MKYFLTIILFVSFVGIAVFGLLKFNHTNHTPEVPMINCPYAENGYSICEGALDHINNWRQFSNVIIPSLSIFSLLILGMVLYLLGKQNFLNQKQHFYKWKYYLDNQKPSAYQEKIIKWLSRFENSPSFLHKA